MFPFYANYEKQASKLKKLKKLSLSRKDIQELKKEIDRLKQKRFRHEEIYDRIFDLFMNGKTEELKDAFSQVQHEYKQDVS